MLSRSWLNYVISVFFVPTNLDLCNFEFFMSNANHLVSYSRVLWQILNVISKLLKYSYQTMKHLHRNSCQKVVTEMTLDPVYHDDK